MRGARIRAAILSVLALAGAPRHCGVARVLPVCVPMALFSAAGWDTPTWAQAIRGGRVPTCRAAACAGRPAATSASRLTSAHGLRNSGLRLGVVGKQPPINMLVNQFLPGKYEPPAFLMRLAHKDVSLATQLGRELGVPMRLSNLTLEEMTEA